MLGDVFRTMFKGAAPEPGADGWIQAFRWGAIDPIRVRKDRIAARGEPGHAARARGYALVVYFEGDPLYMRAEDVPPAWAILR